MPPPIHGIQNLGFQPIVPPGFNFQIPPPNNNAFNMPLNMPYLGQGNQFPVPNNSSGNQGVNFFDAGILPKVNPSQADEILALRAQIVILTESIENIKNNDIHSQIGGNRVGSGASCSSAPYGGVLQETEGDSGEESDNSGN